MTNCGILTKTVVYISVCCVLFIHWIPISSGWECKDKLLNCQDNGDFACKPPYDSWSRINCAKTCNLCTPPTPKPTAPPKVIHHVVKEKPEVIHHVVQEVKPKIQVIEQVVKEPTHIQVVQHMITEKPKVKVIVEHKHDPPVQHVTHIEQEHHSIDHHVYPQTCRDYSNRCRWVTRQYCYFNGWGHRYCPKTCGYCVPPRMNGCDDYGTFRTLGQEWVERYHYLCKCLEGGKIRCNYF